ncbi:unnamed protein product [Rodentolepis nana]|uniref:Uncharacterized protein n=1 Tax=Rodentolepis nana TaxID=102285 RepID=A0A0R3T6X1_RODNA|nr:unnamed protein product [Rodentolepis nana]
MDSKLCSMLCFALFLWGTFATPVNRTQLKSMSPDITPAGFYYYPNQFQFGEIPSYGSMPGDVVYQQAVHNYHFGSYVPLPPMEPVWYPPQSQFPLYFPQPPVGLIFRPKMTKEEEFYKNDPTDRMDPAVHYAILKYMPTIPVELANTLYDMEPNYVKYILSRHQYLPQLLMSMDSTTLNYVLLIGDLGGEIAQFGVEDVNNLFHKMDSPCAYILIQKNDVRQAIIAKAPHLASCRAAPIHSEINTPKSKPTTAKPVSAMSILKLANQRKLKSVRSALPTFDQEVEGLVRKYGDVFSVNADKLNAEGVKQILLENCSHEPLFKILFDLF